MYPTFKISSLNSYKKKVVRMKKLMFICYVGYSRAGVPETPTTHPSYTVGICLPHPGNPQSEEWSGLDHLNLEGQQQELILPWT